MLDTPQLLALHLLALDKHHDLKTVNLIKRVESMHSLTFAQIVRSIYESYTDSEIAKLQERVSKELVNAAKLGIAIITFVDPEYPVRLKKLATAPLILFVKGAVAALNAEQSLAVVGARDATATAKTVATEIALRVAATGASIISGLAIGCDTAGHNGALYSKVGKTVAVLAHGLDQIHPVENLFLSEQIVASGGCLVSIYPIGVKPNRDRYYDRNGIQSGLADATMIVQAAKVQCGTMATAKHCREQRRVLFCLNPNREPDEKIRRQQYKGNEKLIRDGVIAVVNADVVLHHFAAMGSKTHPMFFRGSPTAKPVAPKRKAEGIKPPDNQSGQEQIDSNKRLKS